MRADLLIDTISCLRSQSLPNFEQLFKGNHVAETISIVNHTAAFVVIADSLGIGNNRRFLKECLCPFDCLVIIFQCRLDIAQFFVCETAIVMMLVPSTPQLEYLVEIFQGTGKIPIGKFCFTAWSVRGCLKIKCLKNMGSAFPVFWNLRNFLCFRKNSIA